MRDQMTPVFDLHSDIPTDIARRRAQGEHNVFRTHHYPRLRASGVKAVVFVLWVEPEHRQRSAYRLIELLGALLADFHECCDCVEIVKDQKSLQNVVAAGKVAVVLGVEGMTFVEQWWLQGTQYRDEEEALKEQFALSMGILRQAGLRHAILVWGEQNAIASGPGTFFNPTGRTGLTTFGRNVVERLAESKILIDVSHLDDLSTEEVLDAAPGIVIASHSNARALCDHPRNLADRHLREIGRRDGIVGLNSYAKFVDEDKADMDRFIDHLIYIANLIGIEHVAFGFDFMDYLPNIYGFPERTEGLWRVEDVPGLLNRLIVRGFSEQEIAQVAYYNALRILG
ncbi:dipeptidase [Alicyclobacillus suci]|uniref:dipeptidase n=1 Tax=Alicyclobacillus suci TaxID=2816080 RepID=UPI001A8EAD84|nr:membrane dipeptidase [Alicyclobacillus suci]